jgi:hypothetical protein
MICGWGKGSFGPGEWPLECSNNHFHHFPVAEISGGTWSPNTLETETGDRVSGQSGLRDEILHQKIK